MKIRCCVMAALTMLLVVGLVVPSGAVDDPGGRGDRVATAGGFSDVSGVHAPAVEALAVEGVLDGSDCGTGLFCPDDPLQRSVMAIWLVRMLDGADTAPTASDVFSDVDYNKGYAPFADRLAELAVTRGCATDPLRYCPDENVTRGQMAAFLVRAFDLEAGPNAAFTDVGDGHTFVADIDALAASRVTAGCSTTPLRFCPDRHVTRAQMATFLARAAGLVELPAPVGAQPGEPPVFDPFTTPTVSDIDLERLADAVESLDPDAECAPTATPASLEDVAEVLRITGGCLNVEYVALQGRTIAEVREELASDREVHAVDLPVTDDYPTDFHHDDPDKELWHLEKIEADKLWYGDSQRVLSGWPAGAEVVVAVIDDGVDGSHRDLDANLVTTGDSCHRSVKKDWDGDLNDHGTHVAGIIAAERNGLDVVGVAPEAKILPIKKHYHDDLFDKNGDYRGPTDSDCWALISSTAAAVRMAIEQGADVINMSFGGPTDSDTDEAVIRAAMMRDIVVVASAGNCGTRGPRVCEKDGEFIEDRAYPGVISVASVEDTGKQSDFSTANAHVAIAAPGGQTLAENPGDWKLDEILSTVPPYKAGFFRPCSRGTTCYVGHKSGTSMAAPIISGVVAHMKARFPKASVSEIRQALYTTARNRDSRRTGHFTWEYGWGTVQPADAIRDLTKRFYTCDALLKSGEPLVAYDIDVDIDADGDTVDDDRVGLFDRRDVWLADEAGTDWCRLAHNAAHPAWSPDGEHLAIAHRVHNPRRDPRTGAWVTDDRVDIWVLPIRGGPWRRVTNTSWEMYDLDWSTNDQIAFTAEASGHFAILVVDASGTERPWLLPIGLGGSKYQPSWSPDGTLIAFSNNQRR